MQIAYVYDALYPFVRGGAERRNFELARRLSAAHEVHIVSWRYWDGPPVVVMDGITYHGVGDPPKLYGDDGKRRVSEVLSFSARILPVLLRQRFDIIDCSATPYVPLYAVWLASRLTQSRLLVTWHEFWGDHWLDYLPHRAVVARLARMLESLSRGFGDKLIAVSPFTAARLNVPDDRLLIVGNGIDLAAIQSARRSRQRFDVVYVGRLIDEKRVDMLVDALGLLKDRLPSVRCAIIGDGPERRTLEGRAAKLGLGESLRFMGALADKATFAHLKSSRLLVLPSAREGYGLAVAEAQACAAVPIVVRSPLSAAPYLIRDGIDGRLCEPDPTSIAAAIEGLLLDRSTLDSMAREAERAAADRDWEAVAMQMERAYTETVRRRTHVTAPAR